MISGTKVIKIEVKDAYGMHLIYDGATGRATEHKVPVGVTWEVRVTVHAKSDKPDWGMAATIVATNVLDKYAKQSRVEVRPGAGELDYVFPDFEMGAKSDAESQLRVTFWTTEWKTSTPPPKDKW